MMKKYMPIRWKITILSFGVVLFALMIVFIIFIGKAIENKQQELGDQALITARTVANLPEVKENLKQLNGWDKIQPIVEKIRTINGADYIVVLNMNRIRYSHPVREQLGTLSAGKDEGPAFAEHSYVSTATGELGTAVRGFVPIMDNDHTQIGVVIVGNILPSVWDIVQSLQKELWAILLITMLFGLIGSWFLASHIKDQTFKLEPHEIAGLLEERNATFQAMNEGIIAINNEEKITVFNEKAKEILHIKGDLTGRSIREVLNHSLLPQVLKNKQPIYLEEMLVGNKILLSSRVPIVVNGMTAGAVAIFQDKTEATKLAEELTGVKEFVEALRVQNHEHQNKLHTVAGLIQLEENEKALNYIFESTVEEEKLSNFLMKRINHDNISGLLLGKIKRGKELGIAVKIHPDSRLTAIPSVIDHHDLVIILGNLIENAFYALKESTKNQREVDVLIQENDRSLHIELHDNGTGIPEQKLPYIFDKGFTTKGDAGSGIGLYLIKNIIEKGSGDISVNSAPNKGTNIIIQFPYQKEDE